MKTRSNSVSNFAPRVLILTFVMLLIASATVLAQDEEKTKKKDKPARRAFESAWWFDGQTGVVYNKGTFEFAINHRFGLVNQGNNDLFGIYGPSNIRLGFNYAPIQKLNVGFGYTKNKMILDLHAKYAILTQTRSESMPISLTYYVNMGIEMRDAINYLNSTDRYSYYHQLFVMRRFGSKFSAQIGPSLSHYNAMTWVNDGGTYKVMENDTYGLSVGARYKVTPQLELMLGYDQPLTQHEVNQPKPSINVGVNIVTSAHAFQIFFTNNNRILPQENMVFNQNDFSQGDFLIGFNITRLWSF